MKSPESIDSMINRGAICQTDSKAGPVTIKDTDFEEPAGRSKENSWRLLWRDFFQECDNIMARNCIHYLCSLFSPFYKTTQYTFSNNNSAASQIQLFSSPTQVSFLQTQAVTGLRIFLGDPGLNILLGDPGLRIFLAHPGLSIILGDPGLSIVLCDPGLRMFLGDPGLRIFLADPGLSIILGGPGLRMFLGDPGLVVSSWMWTADRTCSSCSTHLMLSLQRRTLESGWSCGQRTWSTVHAVP